MFNTTRGASVLNVPTSKAFVPKQRRYVKQRLVFISPITAGLLLDLDLAIEPGFGPGIQVG